MQLGKWSITPMAGIVLVIFILAVLAIVLGSHGLQFAGIVVAILIVAFFAAGAAFGNMGGNRGRPDHRRHTRPRHI